MKSEHEDSFPEWLIAGLIIAGVLVSVLVVGVMVIISQRQLAQEAEEEARLRALEASHQERILREQEAERDE